MSKKTLLNEATVRRFMKLANMGTLSDNFVNEGAYGMHQDDEPVEEGHGMSAAYQDDEDEKMDMGDMGDMDAEVPDAPGDEGPEEDEPAPEPEMDMGDDADEVEISEDDRAALSAAIPVLEKIAGGAGGDMDMGDMGVEDDPGMVDEPMEEAAHAMNKDEEMNEKEELDEVELVDENDLVQEVTRRVAARLRAAMKSRK